ncbi:hypothetical protein V502_07923 [Pseudogymnoascus sp. VKM F-4520 (FW-2644)]|nr:hypothetical protein V502_07923 [Pseudogymnoascus sp. VKM F-4520 (FW-2644)]
MLFTDDRALDAMDHLPTVTNALLPLEIPFVAVEEYDGGVLCDYPKRKGRGVGSGAIEWTRPSDAAPFLQTWLYFGLISDFFGTNVKMGEFSRDCSNRGQVRRLLTSRPLEGYIEKWLSTLLLDHQRNIQWYSHSKVKELLKYADHHNKPPNGAEETCRLVCLSITILVQNLRDLMAYVMNRQHTNAYLSTISKSESPLDLSIGHNRSFELATSHSSSTDTQDRDDEEWSVLDYIHETYPVLEERMTHMGWCRNEIARIRSKDLPSTTVNYLSAMRRDFRGRTHQSCSEGHCVAYNIVDSQYKTQHTVNCRHDVDVENECLHIFPPLKKLRSILNNGGIPIIVCQVQPLIDSVDLDVIEWTPDVRYVAFSHVWTDGRGNPMRNSLPVCQILQMHHFIEELQESTGFCLSPVPVTPKGEQSDKSYCSMSSGCGVVRSYFWIDTLCIPVGESYGTLRKKAILHMKETYENAWAVLVLDTELANVSGLGTKEENLARVFCSLWMRRCWTLQELAMAKCCYVKFSDTFCDLLSQVEPNREKWPLSCATRLDFDSTHYYLAKQFKDIVRPSCNEGFTWGKELMKWEQFATAWNCMTWRSTSKEEDRFAILAALLNLDLKKVLETSEISERIRIILSSQQEIPMAILTLNAPRQREDGWRWAPTMAATSALDIKVNEWPGKGLLDSEGLKVTSAGIICREPIEYSRFHAWKEPRSDFWRVVMHFPDETADAVVLARLKKCALETRACYIFDDGPACGALLSLVKQENGIFTVSYDILLVPGGPPDVITPLWQSESPELQMVRDFGSMGQLPGKQPKILFSVCTGSLLLGRAGLFTDMTATSHHMFLDDLREACKLSGTSGTRVVNERYVDSGARKTGMRIVTAGGVSSGLDAACHLVSTEFSQERAVLVAKLAAYEWRRPTAK